jgi:stage II sporulation protein D
VFLAFFCFIPGYRAFAYGGIPYSVRVGLYYDSSGEHKTLARYELFCENGVSVGVLGQGTNYRHLYDFFPKESSKMYLIRHSFAKGFAVATGRDAGSLFEVIARVKTLQQSGYDPQIAYIDGWVLLTGFYDSAEASQQAIDANMTPAFPDYGFTAERLSGKYVIVAIGNTRNFIFDASSGNLFIAPLPSAEGRDPALIEFNEKLYRGAIELGRNYSSDMTAVNVIPLEDYLYGVVPREIQASSSKEALKAQAVAARTYAINNNDKHGASGFDLCRTTHCQVYGGCEAEDSRASQAVRETAGKIVTYRGRPAEVFYFSSSGGHTENVKNVWGGASDYPYLSGVVDKYESGASYNYKWETVYTADEIKARLAESGVSIGDVMGVSVTKTSAAGRAIEVTVIGTLGSKAYTNESCRTFLRNLHSQMYTILSDGSDGEKYASVGASDAKPVATDAGEAIGADGPTALSGGSGGTAISDGGLSGLAARGKTYRFVGRGWGHGVGMSQEGAKGMANNGFKYDQILTHYFPGCAVQ